MIFIPGVIHLPTIPEYRKYNKIDLGTADKLAICFLGCLSRIFRIYNSHLEINLKGETCLFI